MKHMLKVQAKTNFVE